MNAATDFRCFQSLLAAIIEQAVTDYHAAQAAGMIVGGEFAARGPAMTTAGGADLHKQEIPKLVEFFRDGGACDEICTMANFPLTAAAIRSRL